MLKLILTIILTTLVGLLINWVTSKWLPKTPLRWLVAALFAAVTLLALVSLLPDSINNRYTIREEDFSGTSFNEPVAANNLVCMTTGPAEVETANGKSSFPGGDHGTALCWVGPQTVRIDGLAGASVKRVTISSGDSMEIARGLVMQWGNEMTQKSNGCGANRCSFLDAAVITPDGEVVKP